MVITQDRREHSGAAGRTEAPLSDYLDGATDRTLPGHRGATASERAERTQSGRPSARRDDVDGMAGMHGMDGINGMDDTDGMEGTRRSTHGVESAQGAGASHSAESVERAVPAPGWGAQSMSSYEQADSGGWGGPGHHAATGPIPRIRRVARETAATADPTTTDPTTTDPATAADASRRPTPAETSAAETQDAPSYVTRDEAARTEAVRSDAVRADAVRAEAVRTGSTGAGTSTGSGRPSLTDPDPDTAHIADTGHTPVTPHRPDPSDSDPADRGRTDRGRSEPGLTDPAREHSRSAATSDVDDAPAPRSDGVGFARRVGPRLAPIAFWLIVVYLVFDVAQHVLSVVGPGGAPAAVVFVAVGGGLLKLAALATSARVLLEACVDLTRTADR